VNDPHPENITGEKQVQHVVKHSIDWGYVVLGLAAIFALWQFGQLLEPSDDGENDEVTGVCTGD
jgi:hypothetical protein